MKHEKPFVPPSKSARIRCKCCNSPHVGEINLGFVLKFHEVATFQDKFGVAYSNGLNHFNKHVSPSERAIIYNDARTQAAVKGVEADRTDVIATLHKLSGEAEEFLKRAKSEDDLRGGLLAISELRKQVELTAKLLASQKGAGDVILSDNPAWLSVRHIIMSVLNNHPQAKAEFLQKVGTLALGAP